VDLWKKKDIKNKSKGKTGQMLSSGLWIWDGVNGNLRAAVPREKIPAGWMIPADNRLQWTRDSERLFFGFKPYHEYLQTLDEKKQPGNKNDDLYSIPRILEDRGVDVWHWRDPSVNLYQKKQWETAGKKIYFSVYHFNKNRLIPLADKHMPGLQIPENSRAALGFSPGPYQRERSWDHRYRDVYLVDLTGGFRHRVLTRHRQSDHVSLSPSGRFVVYYHQKHWFLYDVSKKSTRILTDAIKTSFFDEDHDRPGDAPGYGIAGWTENGRSVIIYDKYDIWEFYTNPKSNPFVCLTEGKGRKEKIIFRIQSADPGAGWFAKHQDCLLTVFSEKEKHTAFYRVTTGKPGVKKLIGMGMVDAGAIGIYGHSWGGYLAVNMITRTDMFSAAAAGAPVSNLTSAYNAVRGRSGLSRQYHYEKSQGRMGRSLWEGLDLYIENSPLFYANKIKTPLLIEFGDNDGVVPWEQGLELYLALRRLNRACILLQYNDETHHLRGYGNKLDYVIRMKEFLDYYLRGKEAKEWIIKGVPYRKK
jgi:dipeptidyl aminopeptidase/acylaminoacyl peptidase